VLVFTVFKGDGDEKVGDGGGSLSPSATVERFLEASEEKDLDILTACAGCHESLSLAKHELDTKPDRKSKANEHLSTVGLEYKGTSTVLHLHQLFYDKIGLEEIGKKVESPIVMRVVTHSGCHLLRPEEILQVDSSEAPVKLDKLVETLGMEPLEYMDKTMCCGAGIRGQASEISFSILKEKLDSMTMVKPDAAVVFCPTCFISFESGQRIVNKTFGTEFKVPVYYYTELLALAMALPGVEDVLAGHRVRPDFPLVQKNSAEQQIEPENPPS